MIRIAVLITCFNRKNQTIECLANLYSQQGYKFSFDMKVYLVDDKSTDGTSEEVGLRFPDVNLIVGTGDLYWNRGMHRAWEEARSKEYDYYLWLNDDTDLFNDAILEMLECISFNSKPSIVCGAISSARTHKFTYGGISKQGTQVNPNGKIQNCYIINGNCILISESAFKLVGNLDPIFPHAIGDHDYGLRLFESGGEILTTRKFVGNCERNEKLPKWCYSSTPIIERFKALYSPLGNSHPNYYFIYEKRHFGLMVALKHYLSIHLRVLIPSLWKL